MTKPILLSLLIAGVLIGGSLFLTKDSGGNSPASVDNVRIENGIQIVEILARGGYFPRKSLAKAGIPTVLRVATKGTFDCSGAIRIPSLGISKNLQSNGIEEIDIGSPGPGPFRGTCAMGMYNFEIDFQ